MRSLLVRAALLLTLPAARAGAGDCLDLFGSEAPVLLAFVGFEQGDPSRPLQRAALTPRASRELAPESIPAVGPAVMATALACDPDDAQAYLARNLRGARAAAGLSRERGDEASAKAWAAVAWAIEAQLTASPALAPSGI